MIREWNHSRRLAATLLLLAATTACTARVTPPPAVATARPVLMGPQELQALPSQPPDHRIAYGDSPSQYGELRLPAGAGPHSVAVLIHGGCFKSAYATAKDLAPMGDALKAKGIATWNIEYRRVGEAGGGWPGTYQDIGSAIDHLRTLAGPHALNLSRIAVVGHSAGGHLAMWAAGRQRVPSGSAIAATSPLPLRGALNLGGPLDLTANIAGYQALCRDTVITALLGGTPASVPERYAHASPIKLLPLGIPQVILIGEHEDFVPRPLAEAYVKTAVQSGDRAHLIVIPGAGHFEIASPRASTWPQVESAIRALVDGKLPVRHP